MADIAGSTFFEDEGGFIKKNEAGCGIEVLANGVGGENKVGMGVEVRARSKGIDRSKRERERKVGWEPGLIYAMARGEFFKKLVESIGGGAGLWLKSVAREHLAGPISEWRGGESLTDHDRDGWAQTDAKWGMDWETEKETRLAALFRSSHPSSAEICRCNVVRIRRFPGNHRPTGIWCLPCCSWSLWSLVLFVRSFVGNTSESSDVALGLVGLSASIIGLLYDWR